MFPQGDSSFTGNEDDERKINDYYAHELISERAHDQLNESFSLQSLRALSKESETNML